MKGQADHSMIHKVDFVKTPPTESVPTKVQSKHDFQVLRRVALRGLPVWVIMGIISYYLGGMPGLYGLAAGLALVAGYVWVSFLTVRLALGRSIVLTQALMVGGFWLRLLVLGAIVLLLAQVREINLVASLVTFALAYSVVLPLGLEFAPLSGKATSDRATGKGAPDRVRGKTPGKAPDEPAGKASDRAAESEEGN